MTDMTVSGSHGSDQGELIAQLAALRAENDKLKAKAAKQAMSRLKVVAKLLGAKDKDGEACKGNVAVYGLGRFPVTLYPQQWLKLLAMGDEIRDTIEDNRDNLSWKD